MGFMPFSLTKGTLGLRLDYLAQFQGVRDYARERLGNYAANQDPNDHPIEVLKSLRSDRPASEVQVNVLEDNKALFVYKINYLRTIEAPLDPGWSHVGGGERYLFHDSNLHPYNQDSTGNRLGFVGWWLGGYRGTTGVFIDIARAICDAINADTPRLEFWWDCSLNHGAAPTADVAFQTNIARVLFQTDHSAVEDDPNKALKRTPLDPEPKDPHKVWAP